MSYESVGFGVTQPDNIQPVGPVGEPGPPGDVGRTGASGKNGLDEIVRIPDTIMDIKDFEESNMTSSFLMLSIVAQSQDGAGYKQSITVNYPISNISSWRACACGPGIMSDIKLVDGGDKFHFSCYFEGLETPVVGGVTSYVIIELILKKAVSL